MRRRKTTLPDLAGRKYPKLPPSVQVLDVDEYDGPTKPKGKAKPRPKSKRELDQLLQEVERLREKQAWRLMEARHLVGLYMMLHHKVYGVYPAELRTQWRGAVAMAGRMLKHEFGGDGAKMVHFMRWVWTREKKRNDKRGADNDFRIGWRLMFRETLLTDYRVAGERHRRR